MCALQVADLLPAHPDRQLHVAQSIIEAAFRQQAAQMGGELQRLRMAAADKDSHIRSLEDRLAGCQDCLREARSQVGSPSTSSACMVRQACMWSELALSIAQYNQAVE